VPGASPTGTFTGSFTGSLLGSASFATTASAATSITFTPATASFATEVLKTTGGLTVTGALLVSGNTDHAGYFVSASGFSGSGANVTGVVSTSFATTASAATSITFTPATASFAVTSSFLNNSLYTINVVIPSSSDQYAGALKLAHNSLITTAELFASGSGSSHVDIRRSTFATFNPDPNGGTSITGSAPLSMSNHVKHSNALTGWTTSLTADDLLTFYLKGIITSKLVSAVITLRRV
jgi:hypothetical protein